MNPLLSERHGIHFTEAKRKHLHAYIDETVLEKIDQIIPRGMRSKFIENCLRTELQLLEVSQKNNQIKNPVEGK